MGKTRQFIGDNSGLLLVILAQALFSVTNAIAKFLGTSDPPISTLQVIWVRMAVTYLCSLAWMLGAGISDPMLGPKGVRLLLIVRGIAGFVAIYGAYFPLEYLSLSDATVITFLSPLCAGIAGALFLKEIFPLSHAVAGVASLAGVILIAKPPFLFGNDAVHKLVSIFNSNDGTLAQLRMLAVGVDLVGVIGVVAGYIVIRAIGNRAHPLQILSQFAMQSVLVTTIGMIVTGTPFIISSPFHLIALQLLVGILGFLAQVLLTMGLQREAAGRAAMGLYTQIIFATVLQRIMFHTILPWSSIFGTGLILSSAIYVAMDKQQTTPPFGHDTEEDSSEDTALLRGCSGKLYDSNSATQA